MCSKRKSILFLLLIFLGLNFSSCIDCCDEHLDPNEISKKTGPIFAPGIHPVQIGNMIFEYNPDYTIAAFGQNPYAEVTYNPFEIFYYCEYPQVDTTYIEGTNVFYGGYERTAVSNVVFNEQGKIISFSSEFESEINSSIESNEQGNIQLNCYLEYDYTGYKLINIGGEIIRSYYLEGLEKFSTQATFSIDLEWSINNNLNKVTATYAQNDGFGESTEYAFEYGNEPNYLQQYVSSIFEQNLAEALFQCEDIGGIINLKLLGNPSTDFVSKVTVSETEADETGSYVYDYNYSYSYSFNGDSTISSYTESNDDGYSTTWDCIFTDNYGITPSRKQDSRSYDKVDKKTVHKSRLFRKSIDK